MREILLLSGPNLDLLGVRSPDVYGTATLSAHVEAVIARAATADLRVRHLQSNFEGDLIEAVHGARASAVAIIINAGALTHSSWALADALAIFSGPKIEVHLSNPAAREPFRHLSTLAGVVDGSLAGLGGLGYVLAVDAVVHLLEDRETPSRLPGATA
ncbi:MAG: type II 3-dehydroquinate dehydratase [Acidobacteria bacterium]|nr:type II 3-dehydroquinate dehydratase [Acidobacteriota bacterium]